MSRILRFVAGLVLIGLALLLGAYVASRADPIVRRTTVTLPDWPKGAPPITLALLTDIHLGNASMDRARLDRIVDQVNALKPDLVLIGGDFLADYDKPQAKVRSRLIAESLVRLKAPLGTVAVLGNHDYNTDPQAVTNALARIGIPVLQNTATQRGPIVIGGLGDFDTDHANVPTTIAAMAKLHGAHVVLTHSPDAPTPFPGTFRLLLAGHLHCGQIVLPLLGPVSVPVARRRYLCGVVHDGNRTVVVSGGLGTSNAPLRVHAPPDLWLVTVGPAKR
ncbi:putative MPP superfamily phosphohydrolase [Sphingomonas sp. BE270]|jgi:predicted MPP superfamily phosphohydrolase|uniref:metallophosphoesterase n=2 Tax=Sphingomonas TaxID=13687 RepID=UPI0010F680EB|nr:MULTISPECIES: metallophosphoesterase [unclassified Sphingomonas]MDR6847905.1 putative MPP superfamily phosphohydrolase [Sphingomonas sp. BE137]MDR7258415.1 putative MPP superfamily phosphohydrolase [Sphingomonas sp. BE270]